MLDGGKAFDKNGIVIGLIRCSAIMEDKTDHTVTAMAGLTATVIDAG
jgi:hypothetical protein